jgi:uncharacterized protein
MKSAIILHGMPSEEEYKHPESEAQSNNHWLPWLQRRLIAAGIVAQTPELPNPFKPVYEDWKRVFEQFEMNEDTILVGHSCGAGFIVRWLSEHKVKVGKVALVAPWMDPEPRSLTTGFFDFEIDPSAQDRAESISIYSSKDDDEDIHQSVEMIVRAWPNAQHHEFTDCGHFTFEDMKTQAFPELEKELIV